MYEVRIWDTVHTAEGMQEYKDVTLTGTEAELAALYSIQQVVNE